MQKILAKILINLIGAIPYKLRSALGSFLGMLVYLIPSRDKEIAKLQLKMCGFEQKLAKKVYAHLGKISLETFNQKKALSDLSKFKISGFDEIETYKKTGGVLLTAHLGSWDLLAGVGIKLGFDIIAIGREARGGFNHAILSELRERLGVKTLWRKKSALIEIEDTLREKKFIAALIDQDTKVKSIPISFFGHDAATPSTLVELAIKKEIPIFIALGISVGEIFEINVKNVSHLKTKEEILSTFHQALEEEIRKAPEQWVWVHKRWRTNEMGVRRSGKEYLQWLKDQTSNMK